MAHRQNSLKGKKILIFGAGYSGLAIGDLLADDRQVFGTTRTMDRFSRLASAGIEPLLFDGSGLSSSLVNCLADVTHLIVSIAPAEGTDPVLRYLDRALLPKLEWIGYLSTVGVYGNHDGAWVNEQTVCCPGQARSKARLVAEADWRTFAGQAGVPLAILRLAGIYGPGRNGFLKLEQGKARRIVKPGQVFNRIRVEDVAGATVHFAALGGAGIFNVCDDCPAPPQDVVAHTAKLMGVPVPPDVGIEKAELSPMGLSFYAENKRVSNAGLKAAGYKLRFADYKSSLSQMWKAGIWRT